MSEVCGERHICRWSLGRKFHLAVAVQQTIRLDAFSYVFCAYHVQVASGMPTAVTIAAHDEVRVKHTVDKVDGVRACDSCFCAKCVMICEAIYVHACMHAARGHEGARITVYPSVQVVSQDGVN